MRILAILLTLLPAMAFGQSGPSFDITLSIEMPGNVTLQRCDGSYAIVGRSTKDFHIMRPLDLGDIQFSEAATPWDKDRVAELLAHSQYCWFHQGCVVGDHIDPPAPPAKCPAIS